MFEGRGCGAAIQGRRSVAGAFCSNKCQRAHERPANVARWLATGEASIGTGPRHYVRVHLLAEQGGLCAICGIGAEWCGTELRFVLDHIDGDSTNNRRDNLRLVCPDCDSQLPTYKNRNHGFGRHVRRVRYARGQSC